MKIETRIVDEEKGIIQITSTDERWYVIDGKYYPSVTWVLNSYPKGVEFYKWLASKGWDESQAIKETAGDKGNKIHNAISDILAGYEVTIESKFKNAKGEYEELTADECEAVLSFVNWKNEINPKTIAYDVTVYSDQYKFAGTLDYLCEIDGEYWLIDFKTGQNIWDTYALQISSYKKALQEDTVSITNFDTKKNINLAILQVGYNRNKNKYKWSVCDDKFEAFIHTYALWQEQHGGEKPKQIEIPKILFVGKKKDIN